MSKLTLCGWASCDENFGTKGGQAGDQRNGEEVKIGDWNYYGQTQVFRWKSREYAKKYAETLKALCLNDHIGYDQNERYTLNQELKRLNWDYTKLTKDVECDCSALVGAAINATFKNQVISPSVYTGTMYQNIMPTGWFDCLTDAKYCDNDKNLLIGDIINRPYKHVITALEDSNTQEEVVPKTLTATVSNKTRYIGDVLTVADFTITVIMSDGSKMINPQEWSANPLVLTSTSNDITVTYYNLTTHVIVPAQKKATTPVSITATPNKSFKVGDILTCFDLIVKVKMSDGKTLTNPAGWTANPLLLSSTSNKVRVAYLDVYTDIIIPATEDVANKRYAVNVGKYLTPSAYKKDLIAITAAGVQCYAMRNGVTYTIRCGVFTKESYAQKIVDKITPLGLKAEIVKVK